MYPGDAHGAGLRGHGLSDTFDDLLFRDRIEIVEASFCVSNIRSST
jgi:hypothetical protein